MPKKQSGILGSSPCLNSLASGFSSVKWGPGKAERGPLQTHCRGLNRP